MDGEGRLNLTFDEILNTSRTLPGELTIANEQIGARQSVKITPGLSPFAYVIEPLTNTRHVQISLGGANLNEVKKQVALATSPDDTRLEMTINACRDMELNWCRVLDQANSTAPGYFVNDTTPPELIAFDFNLHDISSRSTGQRL